MDAFEQIRRVTLRGDDLAAMLLVIELDEDRLISLREELHSLLEDALQHVLENNLAVDDLDDVVERLDLLRLRADLFGARHDQILERAVLALQLLDAQLIHETRGEND